MNGAATSPTLDALHTLRTLELEAATLALGDACRREEECALAHARLTEEHRSIEAAIAGAEAEARDASSLSAPALTRLAEFGRARRETLTELARLGATAERALDHARERAAGARSLVGEARARLRMVEARIEEARTSHLRAEEARAEDEAEDRAVHGRKLAAKKAPS